MSKRKFFSGNSIRQAVLAAASHFDISPDDVAYREVDKKHGFLKLRKRVIIEVDADDPRRTPLEIPATERNPGEPARKGDSMPRGEAHGDASEELKEPPGHPPDHVPWEGDEEDEEDVEEEDVQEDEDEEPEDEEGEDDDEEDEDEDEEEEPEEVKPAPREARRGGGRGRQAAEREPVGREGRTGAGHGGRKAGEEKGGRGRGAVEAPAPERGGRKGRGRGAEAPAPEPSRGGRSGAAAEEPKAEGRGGDERRGGRRRGRGRGDEGLVEAPAAGRGGERKREARGPLADACRTGLDRILEVAGIDVAYKVFEGDDRMEVEMSGPDEELLVAEDGDLLRAIEHLLPRAMRGVAGESMLVRVNCGDFHEIHEERLRSMAQDVAAEVRRNGRPSRLEPMSPADRRIVHVTLADEPGVSSASDGSGHYKQIVVRPI